MKKIVIIGNSAAGIAAAESIREKDKTSLVTMVSRESFMPYRRYRLLDLLEGKIKERDIYFRNQDFYKNNNLELLLEKEVVNLSVNRKKVNFKDKEFIEFDELIVATGSRVKLPAVKGIQKEGVVAFDTLKDVKFLMENLPLAHTVIMMGSDATAQALARIMAAKKIEVKFFGNLESPLEGVDVISDNPVTEILGDSDVKAVRLTTNKVIGASCVIFCGPREPNVEFLKDTEVKVNRGIVVDNQGRSSVPYIYAAGDVCEFSDKTKNSDWQSAASEGQSVGGSLCLT